MRLGSGRDWAELLRVSALFTVPGDALAGAAATGLQPNRRTLLAIAASLSLYEAGMALNDWADREEDAVERPHRPLPSGRIAPSVALGAAAALTAGGLTLAAAAGRPALTVAGGLAATVWAYDLGLKHTPAGPAAMAAARALDLLLGAAATSAGASTTGTSGPTSPAGAPRAASTAGASRATSTTGASWAATPRHPAAGRTVTRGPGLRAAIPAALVLGAHTLAVTAVSRREAQGGSVAAPLCALAATAGLTQLLARGGGDRDALGGRLAGKRVGASSGAHAPAGSSTTGTGTGTDPGTGTGTSTAGVPAAGPPQLPAGRRTAAAGGLPGSTPGSTPISAAFTPGAALKRTGSPRRIGVSGVVQAALAATYAATSARPFFHAALNPSPELTQRAVGGGIRAMIPLQAALSARTGAQGLALLTAALAPAARKFGRKVSVT
ncbi:SCO3242 family prenyltransferase [Streptomyces sp. NPDC059900]|uniref:SCO3242 family prenyltransferase n=1 Tax=Streptomyces sp. NPDC059900 TaxID=3155816 RepID=UPI00343148D7